MRKPRSLLCHCAEPDVIESRWELQNPFHDVIVTKYCRVCELIVVRPPFNALSGDDESEQK